jgi:response regulator RpfG family c-di-GMP phosphodiesterase
MRPPISELSILSVDDIQMNLELVESVVEGLDGVVQSFLSVGRAIDYARNNRVDLAVVDYMMPVVNGIEFIEIIRQLHPDIPIIMITGAEVEASTRLEAIRSGATEFLQKPVEPEELEARIRNLSMIRQAQLLLGERADRLARQVDDAVRDIRSRELETLFVLGRAAESRDPETREHIDRVARYCRLLAEEMTGDEDFQRLIFHAAPLHDLGKIGVSDSILLKPGSLTPEEWEEMKTHTTRGYRMLEGCTSEYLRAGSVIALTHHEKFDGTGYPQGLKGKEIDLMGRITALADVFDALTTKRPYKEAWPLEDAFELIRKNRGLHFDPELADAFLDRREKVTEIRTSIS